MAGEGLTVLELVDQAVQQCQAVEADADVAVSVATRMSDKAQQKATELEQASTETLEKFEALNGALDQTEQELEALEENRNELAALGEQVEEVISRVEGLTEEINAELSGVLERLSSLAPGLIEAVPEMQEAVAELMQTAQTQAGEIMQQESATSVRGSEVLLQIQEALGELGELQDELNGHQESFWQAISEDIEIFNQVLKTTRETMTHQKASIADLVSEKSSILASEINEGLANETYGNINELIVSLSEFLRTELNRGLDFELSSQEKLNLVVVAMFPIATALKLASSCLSVID